MNENNEEKLDTGGATLKTRALTWLDNFWYHYKWHTLIALFLVFTVTVCSIQMCQKESYNTYVLYAGEKRFSRTVDDGVSSEYTKTKNSLKTLVDGDGTSLAFRDLFIPTSEDLDDIDNSAYMTATQDAEALDELIVSSDYYLCFFSPEVYEKYRYNGDFEIFADLTLFLNDGAQVEFYDGSVTAVYLSSTDVYALEGISGMPSDTLICVRKIPAISTVFNKDESKRAYNAAVAAVTRILNGNP